MPQKTMFNTYTLQGTPYIQKLPNGIYRGFVPDLLDRMGYNFTVHDVTGANTSGWDEVAKMLIDKVLALS